MWLLYLYTCQTSFCPFRNCPVLLCGDIFKYESWSSKAAITEWICEILTGCSLCLKFLTLKRDTLTFGLLRVFSHLASGSFPPWCGPFGRNCTPVRQGLVWGHLGPTPTLPLSTPSESNKWMRWNSRNASNLPDESSGKRVGGSHVVAL